MGGGSKEDHGQMLPSGTNLSGGFDGGTETAASTASVNVTHSTVVPSKHLVDTCSSNNNSLMALPQWMYYPYVPQGYVNLLTGGNSSSTGAGYQQTLPADYTTRHIKPKKNVAIAPSPPWKLKQSPQLFNCGYGWYGASPEVSNPILYGQNMSQLWYGMPQLDVEEQANKLGSGVSQIQIQHDGISTSEGSGRRNGSAHYDMDASLDLASKHQSKSKRPATNYENDRRRRKLISDRIEALQGLLPNSTQRDSAAVLEDIIDFIKYLQFQLKDLSQNRLGGESVSEPLMFIEGFGHYLVDEPVVKNEPLEEMMGRLVEVNPQEAAEILASKGLYVRDMSLAKGLLQEGA